MAADGAAAAAAVPAPAAPLQVIDELIIAPIDRHAAAAPLAEDTELIELAPGRRFSRASVAVHRTAPSVIPSSLCSETMSAVWFLKGTPPEVADKLFKVLRPMTIAEDDDRHNDGRRRLPPGRRHDCAPAAGAGASSDPMQAAVHELPGFQDAAPFREDVVAGWTIVKPGLRMESDPSAYVTSCWRLHSQGLDIRDGTSLEQTGFESLFRSPPQRQQKLTQAMPTCLRSGTFTWTLLPVVACHPFLLLSENSTVSFPFQT